MALWHPDCFKIKVLGNQEMLGELLSEDPLTT
jgi:hypothetical protein